MFVRRQLGLRVLLAYMALIILSSRVLALNLAVTSHNDPVRPGEPVYYRIVVSNTDNTTRNDVVVQATIPDHTILNRLVAQPNPACPSLTGPSHTCSPGEPASWTFPSLPPGTSVVIEAPYFVATNAPQNAVISPDLSVTYTGAAAPLSATRAVTVTTNKTASLALASRPQVAGPGELLHYEISFANVSGSSLSGVQVQATTPAGTRFIGASDGGVVAPSNDTVLWDLSAMPIAPGAGSKLTFTVAVNPEVEDGTVLVSTAQLNMGGVSLAQASDSIVVRANAGLTLDVAVSGDPARPGELIYYQYTLANRGDVPLADVSLHVLVPPATSLQLDTAQPAGTCPSLIGAGNNCTHEETVSWELGILAAGESRVVLAAVEVAAGNAAPRAGELIIAPAQVRHSANAYTLGTRAVVLSQPEPVLRLGLTSEHSVREVGEVMRYEVSFGNVSATSLEAVTLHVTLPPGTTLLRASDGGMRTPAGDAVSWDLGLVPLRRGGKRTFTVQLDETLGDGTVLVSTAQVRHGGRSLAWASDSVVVRANAGLTLDVAVSGDPARPGELIYYQYTLANRGDVPLADVSLHVLVPQATSLELDAAQPAGTCPSLTGSGRNCDQDETVSWELGTLAAGESRVVLAAVEVAAGNAAPRAGELIIAPAQVRHSANAYTLGTRPMVLSQPEPVLRLGLASAHGVRGAGEMVRYEVSFGNISATSLEEVGLEVTLPPGMILRQASDGGVLTPAGDVVSWDLGLVPLRRGGKRTFTVQLDETLGDGTVLRSTAQLRSGGQNLAWASDSVVVRANAGLTLDAAVSGDPARPEELIYYQYTLANRGDVPLADVSLHVLVPQATSLELQTFTPLGTCPSLTGSGLNCTREEPVSWELGTLGAGESRVVLAAVQVATGSSAPLAGELIIAHALGHHSANAYTLSTRSAVLSNPTPTLRIAAEADMPVIAPNGLRTLTFSVGNVSSSTVNNILLTATLPQELRVISATENGLAVNNTLFWPLGHVPANTSIAVSVAVRARNSLTSGTVMIVNADVESDSDLRGLSRTQLTLVGETAPRLRLEATAIPTVNPGEDITYQLDITNDSNAPVADVQLGFLVPQFTSAALPPDGRCPSLAGSSSNCLPYEGITWELGNLGAGQTVRRSIAPAVSTGTPAGTVLVAHAQVDDTSSSRQTLGVTRTTRVGGTFVVAPDHDSDSDQLPDRWELQFGLNRLNPADAAEDFDNDGFSNAEEFLAETDPTNADTDDDGVLDGVDAFPLVNQPPVADAGMAQVVEEGIRVQLNGARSSDPDGGPLSFQWRQTRGPRVTLSNNSLARPIFMAPVGATDDLRLTFELTVQDGGGLSASQTVDVRVVVCTASGDVDQDGSLTPADVISVFQQFLGSLTPELSPCQQRRANVVASQDSVITPADARCIFRSFLGLASCLNDTGQ